MAVGQQEHHDIAVIGAGVVGCAIARRFALSGARVVVLEKASDILDGASKGNSAILHTGFDAPPDSLELACISAGYAEYIDIHDRLGLPLIRTGALVIAWTEAEAALLPSLMEQARVNGVTDVQPLTREEALAFEPNLAPTLHAAFRVPREHIVDPWSAPYGYLLQAVENGAELQRGAEVLSGAYDREGWRLETTQGQVRARWVVNAAGLYGDVVDERLTGQSDLRIRPRKGQFVVYDKPASALASHILLPVPNPVTKGVVVCRTAFGNLLVGPTAEDQEARDEAVLVPEALKALQRRGEEIIPALRDHAVTALYAGLRPASERKEYRIRLHDGLGYVTVAGIRSTGLSAALGIARHVESLVAGEGDSGSRPPIPCGPAFPTSARRVRAIGRGPAMGGSSAIASSSPSAR